MNWYRENRFVSRLLAVFGVSLLFAIWFLWRGQSTWRAAATRFRESDVELSRLEQLAMYPNSDNLRQAKADADSYAVALAKMKDELKKYAPSIEHLAPNEFQSHLRLATAAVAEKARAAKIALPEKFFLGFDEFASALPNSLVAPLLGQELKEIEWLFEVLIAARVDALTAFRRTPLREEHGAPIPSATPGNTKFGTASIISPEFVDRHLVEMGFTSTPGAARKVLNQISGASEHFVIVRLVHIRNEKEKGPLREVAVEMADGDGTNAAKGKPPPPAAVNFIVGNERIEVRAKIELVRFIL